MNNAAETNRMIMELYRKEFGEKRLEDLLTEIRAFTVAALKVAEKF